MRRRQQRSTSIRLETPEDVASEIFNSAREQYGPNIEIQLQYGDSIFECPTEADMIEFIKRSRENLGDNEFDEWTILVKHK